MAERKAARRRRFLDTAIALFGRLGYHAATVPMIVAEAQSSTGAFYLYFRNKEDVYAAALQEIAARLAAALNQAVDRQSGPDARMGAAVEGFVRWLGGRLEEAHRAVIESRVRSVAAALESAAPWVDAHDRGVLARCWVGAILEVAMNWLRMQPGERPDAARLARTVRNFNLRGAGMAVQDSQGGGLIST